MSGQSDLNLEVPISGVRTSMEGVSETLLYPQSSPKRSHLSSTTTTLSSEFEQLKAKEGSPDIEQGPSRRTKRAITKLELRTKLSNLLSDRGVRTLSQLLGKAESGQLKDQDTIKLLDVLLKYGIGPITTQEITGEDGAAVQVQFTIGTSKPDAELFLRDVRERVSSYLPELQGNTPALPRPSSGDISSALDAEIIEGTEQTAERLYRSDNDQSDATD